MQQQLFKDKLLYLFTFLLLIVDKITMLSIHIQHKIKAIKDIVISIIYYRLKFLDIYT